MATAKASLLSLPAELRTQIYQQVAAQTTCLTITQEGYACPPALLRVCRSMREEAYHLTECNITSLVDLSSVVIDLDFSHVLRFVKANPTLLQGRTRHLHLTLRITNDMGMSMEGIKQWCELASTAESATKYADDDDDRSMHNLYRTTICGIQFLVTYNVMPAWDHRFTGKECALTGIDECDCVPGLSETGFLSRNYARSENARTMDAVRREIGYEHMRGHCDPKADCWAYHAECAGRSITTTSTACKESASARVALWPIQRSCESTVDYG